MKPLANHVIRDHVIIGGIASALLLPTFGFWGSLIFWVSTILIDLDHYLHFLICSRFKRPGVQAMFRFHEELFKRRHRSEFLALEIFHTAEFLLVFGLVSFYGFPALTPVFWGMLFHLAVDFVHLSRYGILGKRSHSFLEYYWRRRQIRASGRDPEKVFEEALQAMA